jgi:zinc protease
MIFEEHIGATIKGVAIGRAGERMSHTFITIDTHDGGNTASKEAVLGAYTQLLLTGCGTYTKQEFLDALLLVGGEIQVHVNANRLHISVSVLEEHHAKAFTLLSLMLTQPRFDQKELTRIQTLMQDTLEQDKEDAKTRSYEAFANSVTGSDHRMQTASFDALALAIPKIKRKDIQDLHKDLMSRMWLFTLVTDESKREKKISALTKLRDQFDHPIHKKIVTHDFSSNSQPHVTTISIPSKENIEVNIGSALPFTLSDEAYPAFWFGLNVLGKWGGFAGRLMSTVREKEGLTYGIYAKMEGLTLDEHGFWRVMSFFSPAKVEQGITSTIREITTIANNGISLEEYKRFMHITETGQALLQDSILKIANDVHNHLVRGFSLHAMQEHKSKLLAVTHAEVNTALGTYLRPSALSGSFAGPTAQKEKEIRTLFTVAKKSK